jgi:hypothetical protein
MLPSLKRLALAILWLLAATAAAFAGGAAAVVALSWDVNAIWQATLATLALVPSIALYLLLDWWRPESRARQIGFAVPLIVGAVFLAALYDALPRPIDTNMIAQYVFGFAASLTATWLVFRARRHYRDNAVGRLQFSISSLFLLTTFVAILMACLKSLGTLAGSLTFTWAIVVVLLMIAVQGTERIPRRGWPTAILLAIVAIYGPHLIVASHTWLFNACDHCHKFWLVCLWVMPGGIIELLVLRISHDMPPAVAYAIAAAISLVVIGVTAWLAKLGSRARWVALAIVGCLAVVSALAADMTMRA